MTRLVPVLGMVTAAFFIANCERCSGCDGFEPRVPAPVVMPPTPIETPPVETPPIIPSPAEGDAGVVPQSDEPKVSKAATKIRKHKKIKRTVEPTYVPPAQPEPVVPAERPVTEKVSTPTGTLTLTFDNNMGPEFKLLSYRVFIDGVEFMAGTGEQKTKSKTLLPGPHALDVQADYRGNDRVFTYFNDYKFHLDEDSPGGINMVVDANDRINVYVQGYLSGSGLNSIEKRPALKVDVAKNVAPYSENIGTD